MITSSTGLKLLPVAVSGQIFYVSASIVMFVPGLSSTTRYRVAAPPACVNLLAMYTSVCLRTCAQVGAKKGQKPAAVGEERGARRLRRNRCVRAGAAAAADPGPSPLARKVLGFTRCVAGTGIIAMVVGCAVVVMFAPHTPGVNVCNTEFDWVRQPPLLLFVFVCFVFPRASALWAAYSTMNDVFFSKSPVYVALRRIEVLCF